MTNPMPLGRSTTPPAPERRSFRDPRSEGAGSEGDSGDLRLGSAEAGIARLTLVPKAERQSARCLLVAPRDGGALAESASHLMGLEMGEVDFTCEPADEPFELVWVLGLDACDGARLADLRERYPEARLIASGRQVLAHERHLRERFGVDRLVDYPAAAVRLRRVLLEELQLGRAGAAKN